MKKAQSRNRNHPVFNTGSVRSALRIKTASWIAKRETDK